MSWIQENTFVAGLAGATAVISGAILFFGITQGGGYDEKLENFEELKAQHSQLEKSAPYPTYEHRRDRESGMVEYEQTIKEVRQLVMGYRPEKLEAMTPEQFKDIRVKMEDDLRKAFVEAGTTLPENCLFGFERYESGSVKAGATAKLHYELGAIQWLLEKLAAAKPESITNIRRGELPEESGRVAPPKPKKGRSKSGAPTAAGRVYELMPMEISFTANESVVRDFLIEMVNSQEYYYAIRGVRIRNEKQIAPSQKDANFPAPVVPAMDDAFTGIGDILDGAAEDEDSPEEGAIGGDFGESAEEELETPAQPAIPAGELVLKQVLGDEKLHVHIAFDIVLIEKKGKNPKPSGKSRKSKTES